MEIRIENDQDHEAAIKLVSELMNAEPGTSEADDLDRLVQIVMEYEEKRWPISEPGRS